MMTPLVCFMLALLLQALLSASLGVMPAAESPPNGRYIVQLHRQRVPVRSDSDIISYKSVYFGTVSIGSPVQQEFSMVFDTGSGHVIVPSNECNSETCLAHRMYNRQASEFAEDVDYDGTRVQPGAPRDQITVAFGTGEVTGHFVNDRFCLGQPQQLSQNTTAPASPQKKDPLARVAAPLDADSGQGSQLKSREIEDEDRKAILHCVQLRIVTATEMSHEPFHSFAFDGVLGLGMDSLALAPEFSFFGVMSASQLLAEPSFGVFLASHDDETSEISFGGHTPELVRGSLTWASVAMPELGYWQVHIKHLRLGNRTLDFCEDGGCRAVVDTGTSLLAVPESFSEELQQDLEADLVDPPETSQPSDGESDCKHATGHNLYFDIEGLTITLSPGDYSRKAIQLDDEGSEITTSAAPSGEPLSQDPAPSRSCWPTLMPLDLPEPLGPKLFIWGEPVLRKYYTVYHWKDKQIGFGLAVHRNPEEEAEVAAKPQEGPRKRPLLL